MESFSPAEPFDVVIFCESIYSSTDPAGTLEKTAGWLAPGGTLLLSVWRDVPRGDHERYWKMISRSFVTNQATTITNRLGLALDVRILLPLRSMH